MGLFSLPNLPPDAAHTQEALDELVRCAIDNLKLYQQHGGDYLLHFSQLMIERAIIRDKTLNKEKE